MAARRGPRIGSASSRQATRPRARPARYQCTPQSPRSKLTLPFIITLSPRCDGEEVVRLGKKRRKKKGHAHGDTKKHKKNLAPPNTRAAPRVRSSRTVRPSSAGRPQIAAHGRRDLPYRPHDAFVRHRTRAGCAIPALYSGSAAICRTGFPRSTHHTRRTWPRGQPVQATGRQGAWPSGNYVL